MARNGYLPCINNFTRVINLSGSCIDHIFIKNIKINKGSSYILRCDITDHYATILFSYAMVKKNVFIKLLYFKYIFLYDNKLKKFFFIILTHIFFKFNEAIKV